MYILILVLLFLEIQSTPFYELRNFHNIRIDDTSIFFLETSEDLQRTGKLFLPDRVSCAVESAALHHPDREIYLIYIVSKLIETITYNDIKYFNILRSYPNVNIVQASINQLIKDVQLDDLIKRIKTSPFKVVHLSDIFRAVLLCKYGGIYFDSDVIVLKSFDNLDLNFAGAESKDSIANGILGFQEEAVRRTFMCEYLIRCKEVYKSTDRTICGPKLLTLLLQKRCNKKDPTQLINTKCSQISIYNPQKFYAVSFDNWKDFFDSSVTNKVLQIIKNSHAVHIWNSGSHSERTLSDLNSTYVILAKKHCPRTYYTLTEFL